MVLAIPRHVFIFCSSPPHLFPLFKKKLSISIFVVCWYRKPLRLSSPAARPVPCFELVNPVPHDLLKSKVSPPLFPHSRVVGLNPKYVVFCVFSPKAPSRAKAFRGAFLARGLGGREPSFPPLATPPLSPLGRGKPTVLR